VSVDPVPLRPEVVVPEKDSNTSDEDYYWLGGIQ
jgi:hypothetical protein